MKKCVIWIKKKPLQKWAKAKMNGNSRTSWELNYILKIPIFFWNVVCSACMRNLQEYAVGSHISSIFHMCIPRLVSRILATVISYEFFCYKSLSVYIFSLALYSHFKVHWNRILGQPLLLLHSHFKNILRGLFDFLLHSQWVCSIVSRDFFALP